MVKQKYLGKLHICFHLSWLFLPYVQYSKNSQIEMKAFISWMAPNADSVMNFLARTAYVELQVLGLANLIGPHATT